MSVGNEGAVDPFPQSFSYEELVEVVTRVVAKLNLDWPAEKQDVRFSSKLDYQFLRARAQPLRRDLPFVPDVHAKVLRHPYRARLFCSHAITYSNIVGLNEQGYGTVEQTLASYLPPVLVSSL